MQIYKILYIYYIKNRKIVNIIFLVSRAYNCDIFWFIFSKKNWKTIISLLYFSVSGLLFPKIWLKLVLISIFSDFLSLILPIYLYPLPRNMDQNLQILLFILRAPITHFATLQEIEYTPNQGYHLSYMWMIRTFRIFAWFGNIRGVKKLYLLFFCF